MSIFSLSSFKKKKKKKVMIVGPDSTMFEGGFFTAHLDFPHDFPNQPPEMKFISEMWHPNVYEDGRVCISILHPPGEDEFNAQESVREVFFFYLFCKAPSINMFYRYPML
jgi:ubiquitin-protein ligase